MKRRFDPSSFEPAFPNQLDAGISIRDYFACQALTGLLASPDADIRLMPQIAAQKAYQIADLMLTERKILREKS